jgi:hypothetical protein
LKSDVELVDVVLEVDVVVEVEVVLDVLNVDLVDVVLEVEVVLGVEDVEVVLEVEVVDDMLPVEQSLHCGRESALLPMSVSRRQSYLIRVKTGVGPCPETCIETLTACPTPVLPNSTV